MSRVYRFRVGLSRVCLSRVGYGTLKSICSYRVMGDVDEKEAV